MKKKLLEIKKEKETILCLCSLIVITLFVVMMLKYTFTPDWLGLFFLSSSALYSVQHYKRWQKCRAWVRYYPLIAVNVPCLLSAIADINMYDNTYWVFVFMMTISPILGKEIVADAKYFEEKKC